MINRSFRIVSCTLPLFLAAIWCGEPAFAQASPNSSVGAVEQNRSLPDTVTAAFERGGENRDELEKAWQEIAENQRPGLQFLLENMPDSDLTTLSAEYLLENISLAYQAREESPWGQAIPEAIFLNDVLPYANINERRDNWRKDFRDRFLPIVKDIQSPGLAAARLNQTIFNQLNVKYSTRRHRADQGPRESIESGLASCTGLSILLIDACRSVGIPARFVGTPLWTDNSGNHSWVEVWDQDWHFTGAAEAAGDNLDQAWFTDRASTATLDDDRHGIFAVSFRKTPLAFPMVWARENKSVSAVNVTVRYVKKAEVLPEGIVRTRFKILGQSGFDRCQANVVIKDDKGEILFRGQSKDERFDSNDHLTAALPVGKSLAVEVQYGDNVVTEKFVASEDGKLVTLRATTSETAITALREFLSQPAESRPAIADQAFASIPLSKREAEEARKLLWQDHKATIAASRKEEMEKKVITVNNISMPFEMITYGEKPESGRSLVISMHGGGGTTKAVNDQQWRNQKKLYELSEGIYVAPRAPTNTWNLWHQDHIDPLFTRLIENLIAMEDVNPNRVYITGYSAGGDGVFQLAPRMADQLAAAAMMAGHPNETQPLGLRNLPFTLHMGGKDAAYNRNGLAKVWADQLADLRKADPAGYQHWVEIYPDKGHWMDRLDGEGVKWMLKYDRNITPDKIVWLQDDVTHSRFYWLAVDQENASAGQKIVAKRDGSDITIDECSVDNVSVMLRDDMTDLDQVVTVRFQEKVLFQGKVDRCIRNIIETLTDRGDPEAVFCSMIQVKIDR